jgi:hypothetical protein
MARLVFAALALVCLTLPSEARDLGQWANSDPLLRRWYQSLTQPDNWRLSCCGEADAYYADEIHVRDGKVYATITDDRPDEPLQRPHIPVGTVVEIPPHKLKFDDGNPTGHTIVFMARGGDVYCFVQGSGI